ncbi:MAG: NUDIX hydrolase [Proteobacteria bacterium]|nr:NUDIX hydrolase [Pseudomonadota bacterium]
MERRRIEPWRLLNSIYSFSDRWLKLRSDTVRLPGGSTLTPYHVIEAADWVNVVAISEAGCIVLVEQYRHAVTRTMLEIPAGHVDPNERPEAAARRELQEETGYGGGQWHALGALHPAASRFSNQVHSFLALGVTRVSAPAQEESENLHLHEIPWAEFVAGLQAGTVRLPEANQMSSLLLVHLLASASDDPEIRRLRL